MRVEKADMRVMKKEITKIENLKLKICKFLDFFVFRFFDKKGNLKKLFLFLLLTLLFPSKNFWNNL